LLVCAALAASLTAHAATLRVQVSNGPQPLAEAVVHVTPVGSAAPARAKRELTIEQINKQFVPMISVVQTGTAVSFPNRDPIRHHVYSFSPAKTFEIKLYSGVPATPVVFDKPGEVVLGCNIHDHMVAHVLVVDTPYFAKTDAKGAAIVEHLPAGEYEVQVWYPGVGHSAKRRQRLAATETAMLDVALPVKALVTPRPAPGQ
jgi:plastocyanin